MFFHLSPFSIAEPPVEDGGAAVQSYVAQVDGGSGYIPVYEDCVCECSCTNLLPGHTYRSRVAARNEVGQGHWSDSVQITTKPVCPGVCGKPWVHGKPKAHYLHIKWGECQGYWALNRTPAL